MTIFSSSSKGLAIGSALAAASLLAGSSAHAQVQPQPPPQITVSARGEVQVAPDKARVQVGVETQAKTAAAAADENNRKQAAILRAVRALGIPASAITTLNYNVFPVERYDEKDRRSVIDGYRVSNIVQVESDKLEQAGSIIDAALNNGANRVAGLDFMVKDASAARDQALAKAVQSAKRQATAAALAAGGQATELLELNVNEFEQPTPRPMMAMRVKSEADAVASTPLSEGMTTVSVMVTTRWRFVMK
ncbi:MAG: SIMPL domain-containing protein [Gemmatimonadota bacterium]